MYALFTHVHNYKTTLLQLELLKHILTALVFYFTSDTILCNGTK